MATTRIVVQRQFPSRAEIIVGTTYEPGLGHFLVAGLGGVHAELLDSVILLPVSLAPATISKRICATKVGALLARLSRGTGRDLTAEIVAVLVALQALVTAAPDDIASIDVNPLLIGTEGALAVDALIVPRRA